MFGNCEGPRRHMPGFCGAHPWLEGIDLSDEQIEKIAELKQKSFSRMAHGRIDKTEMMQAIFKALASPDIDRAKVAELKARIKELKASMVDLMIDKMLGFAEILTPEQRKKIHINKIRRCLGSHGEECVPPHDQPHHHHD